MAENHFIIPFRTLIGNALALMVLTALTVAVYYIDLPDPFNLIVALGIAFIKATLVALIFMALYWDNQFNTLVLLSSLLFFLVFVVLTLMDTLFRELPFTIF